MHSMSRYIIAFSVFFALSLNGCGGDCLEDVSLIGTITDASYNPLPAVGVRIRLRNDDPNKTLDILGLTDNQGKYNFIYSPTSSIDGAQLEFVKAGYVVSVADKFNVSENATCDFVTYMRDAVLQLQ